MDAADIDAVASDFVIRSIDWDGENDDDCDGGGGGSGGNDDDDGGGGCIAPDNVNDDNIDGDVLAALTMDTLRLIRC